MSLLLELSAEILCEIAGDLPVLRDIHALCHTSKLLYNVFVDILYREIVVYGGAKIVRCCRTLSSNRLIAGKVRQLSVDLFSWCVFLRVILASAVSCTKHPNSFDKSSSFYRLIISTLSCLSLMTNLSLYCGVISSSHLWGLEHIFLDSLAVLSMKARLEGPFINFISRNNLLWSQTSLCYWEGVG
jgi:hypothetical protein